MAETTTHQRHPSAAHRAQGARPRAERRASAEPRDVPAATTPRRRDRSTPTPSSTTARRARTTATRETREAAQANARAAKVTAEQGRNVAERAALVYVGATLDGARPRARARRGPAQRDHAASAPSSGSPATSAAAPRRAPSSSATCASAHPPRARAAPAPASAPSGSCGARERTAERRPNVVAERVARGRDGRPGRRRRRRAPRRDREGARRRHRLAATLPRPPTESGAAGQVRRPHIPPADAAPSPPSTAGAPSGTARGL